MMKICTDQTKTAREDGLAKDWNANYVLVRDFPGAN